MLSHSLLYSPFHARRDTALLCQAQACLSDSVVEIIKIVLYYPSVYLLCSASLMMCTLQPLCASAQTLASGLRLT